MKLKAQDLRMVSDYADKEGVQQIQVTLVDKNFEAHFEFVDAEGRECNIICYDVFIQRVPDLIKKMQLQTRLKKETT